MASANDIARATAENQRLREDLALAYRALAYYDMQEGIETHLTVLAPSRNGNGDVMLITPYNMHWTQATACSLIGVDLKSGKVVEGHGQLPSFSAELHLAIHRAKVAQGITCVMHTHQSYAAAITCCHGRLLNTHQNGMRFHNKIVYDDSYKVATSREGERCAALMGDKNILFMGNHGITVCGKRICDAFDDVYFIERAAKAQVLAMSTGMKLIVAPEEVAEEVANFEDIGADALAHFESMRPVISKMEPDYRS